MSPRVHENKNLLRPTEVDPNPKWSSDDPINIVLGPVSQMEAMTSNFNILIQLVLVFWAKCFLINSLNSKAAKCEALTNCISTVEQMCC